MTSKKILIVDDNPFDRDLLAKALQRKAGLECLTVASGEECLALLARETIDLILMDIMMPGELGPALLVKIRETYNPIILPVIMVTSKSDTSDIVQCLHLGANDYITKPVNFDVALSRISTHLTLAEVSKDMGRLQEIEALDAIITTYNHEINNPLAIALASLERAQLDAATVERIRRALWRVADIVKKIDALNQKRTHEYIAYRGSKKMLKIS